MHLELSGKPLQSGATEMTANQKAREWAEIKELEKDFFHELQFVSARVRRMKRVETAFAIIVGILVSSLLLVVLFLAVKDFWN
jgi:hypothetical protein